MKVSVIVPVYNAEKYLRECLDSLVGQTLPELEIIAVDDCSADSSREILKEYGGKYPDRVRIIFNETNRGPGGARNAGIEIAQGEYIGFADNDDYLAPAMFEKLYQKASETGADIVDSGFVESERKRPCLTTPADLCGELNNEKRLKMMTVTGFIWSKIFKHSLFTDNNIKLLENTPCDDYEFLATVYAYADRIENVKEIFYVHREHKDSFSHSLPLPVITKNCMDCCDEILRKYKALPDFSYFYPAYEFKVANYYVKLLNAFLVENTFRDMSYPEKLREWAGDCIRNIDKNEFCLKFIPEEFRALGRKDMTYAKIVMMKKHIMEKK